MAAPRVQPASLGTIPEGDEDNMNNASSTNSTAPLTADEVKALLTEAHGKLDNGEDIDVVISFLEEKGVDADDIKNIILGEVLKLTAGGYITEAVNLLLDYGLRSEATTIVYATAINMRATGKDAKTIQGFISTYGLTMRQIEERYNTLREEIRKMIIRDVSPGVVNEYAQRNGIPTATVIEIVKSVVDAAPSMNRATTLKSLYNIPDYVPQIRPLRQMAPGTATAVSANYGELAPPLIPAPAPKPSNVGIRALVAAQAGTNIGAETAAEIRRASEAQRAEEARATREREEAEGRARIAKQAANRQTALAKVIVGAAGAKFEAEAARQKAADDARAEIDIRRKAEIYYNIISQLLNDLESRTGIDQVNSISAKNQTVQKSQPPKLNKTLSDEELTLRDRDKRQGWLGPKETRASYAKYVKNTLLRKQNRLKSFAPFLADRDPYLEAAQRVAQKIKVSATEVFNALDNWRKIIISKGIPTEGVKADVWKDIEKIKKPGWLGVSRDYVPTIMALLDRYTKGDTPGYKPVEVVRTEVPRVSYIQQMGLRYGKPAAAAGTAPAPAVGAAPAVEAYVEPPSAIPKQSLGSVTVDGETIHFGGGRSTRKTAASRRMARRRTQRGGATPMPLAYYQPGAYETRMLEATGAGIAGASGSWIREPVAQTGGRRTRRHARHSRRQSGGFTPSAMGQFASAGLRLLPVAGYMGYKMFNKKSHKAHKKAGRRTRRR
jgi:hypothetical protein